jgi:hypothetical protein
MVFRGDVAGRGVTSADGGRRKMWKEEKQKKEGNAKRLRNEGRMIKIQKEKEWGKNNE